jgi:hypothetical protein
MCIVFWKSIAAAKPARKLGTNMSRRMMGLVLILFGGLLMIVALTADATGLGSGTGVGWKQLTGAGFGILVAIIGLWWSQGEQKPKQK